MRWAVWTLGFLVAAELGNAQSGDWLADGRLEIQGSRLTLFADAATGIDDADQVVSVGQPTRVRTCYGSAATPCGSVSPGDPAIAGLVVRAELSGPELPEALTLETPPGGSFLLPSLRQTGTYLLANIRLVDQASGLVLGHSDPPQAVIQVAEILLASATVTTLSLEDLQARGISLSAENYQAFSFAVGFAFEGYQVAFEMPIVYTSYGTVLPLARPSANLDGLPSTVAQQVSRWQPPTVLPFRFEAPPEEGDQLRPTEVDEVLSFPLFGAIVMPGTVSYLNQFFDVQLIVANGAPVGSAIVITDLDAALNLPAGNRLRLVASEPPVAPGQRVPLLATETGERWLDPGATASASWTVEGLRAGTHALVMDIAAQLERPGHEPFPLQSRAQAAVEVVDARFNLTFSHPNVVRENTDYSLWVTVTNLSRVTQNNVTIALDGQHMSGAHAAISDDNLVRPLGEPLEPGEARTVEFPLVAELTGRVVAWTFESGAANGSGNVVLYTGVGELGVPLSPASLVLPEFTDHLLTPDPTSGSFLRAMLDFLGLAYSLATAPAGLVPAGLPRVIPSDVERRAVDLGEAGQRVFLQDDVLASFEVLALDLLGNREPLAEIDELRRKTAKGAAATREMASQLRWLQDQEGLGARELFDHFIDTTSYTEPFVAVTVIPYGSVSAPVLQVSRWVDGEYRRMTGDSEASAPVRTLPFGEILAVSRTPGSSDTVPLALVGHLSTEAGNQDLLFVDLQNDGPDERAGEVVVVVPDHETGRFRRLELGTVSVPPWTTLRLEVSAALDDFVLRILLGAGSATVVPVVYPVDLPPFRIIGAVQHYAIEGPVSLELPPEGQEEEIPAVNYGQSVLYLFNRPPAAAPPTAFAINSSFAGLDVADRSATATARLVGTAAHQQASGRVVVVRYSGPPSSLLDDAGVAPLVAHEHDLETAEFVDGWDEPLSAEVPELVLETSPRHLGGLVDGYVIRGTGELVAGASVELIRPREVFEDGVLYIVLDHVASTVTDESGRYFFELVEEPPPDPFALSTFRLRVDVPAGDDPLLEPHEQAELATAIRIPNRLVHVNFALPGRGTVSGRLVHAASGEPVASGRVDCASLLFNEPCGVVVTPADNGEFQIPAVAVGPVTLTGRADGTAARVYQTVVLTHPGDSVDVVLAVPDEAPATGFGTVTGRVVLQRAGTPAPPVEPLAGVSVAVTAGSLLFATVTTNAHGHFQVDDVPEGFVSLQAADWRIARTSALHDVLLHAGETAEVTLTLLETQPCTVHGLVQFDDPVTATRVAVDGATVFVEGTGLSTVTDADGRYVVEGVPAPGLGEYGWAVTAVDFVRGLSGTVRLPAPLPTPFEPPPIVLAASLGGITGVVLDPFGQPAPFLEVLVGFEDASGNHVVAAAVADGAGHFSFAELPLREYLVTAHLGDGLVEGHVGYIGSATVTILYGGHRPFVPVQMLGSGLVDVTVDVPATVSELPLYLKATYFSEIEKRIRIQGSYTRTSIAQGETLRFELPVGKYELVSYHPFHGTATVLDRFEYPGQVRHATLRFAATSTVTGRVVDVDGVTPVAGVDVVLNSSGLLPQTQSTDSLGGFRFELVPAGSVAVTVASLVGTVDRFAVARGLLTGSGQTLDLELRLGAQGSVRGQVFERVNGELRPLAHAHYVIQEGGYPNRRWPDEGFYTTDAEGRFERAHVAAGKVAISATDRIGQRAGRANAVITADWQVVAAPDIVMSSEVGSIDLLVRDTASGAPVPDCLVELDHFGFENPDYAVTDGDGRALFIALPVDPFVYTISALHPPTGRSGRLDAVQVGSAATVTVTLYLDTWGEVSGVLLDGDVEPMEGVPGGVVQLAGITAAGSIRALASTSGEPEAGAFLFPGIPEGSYELAAALYDSPRRAHASVELTADSPRQRVAMVLESQDDLFFSLHADLRIGLEPVVASAGGFSVSLELGLNDPDPPSYSATKMQTVPGTELFRFEEALVDRNVRLTALEIGGEQRSVRLVLPELSNVALLGSGSEDDPYQLVLEPKGTAVVHVVAAGGAPVAGAVVSVQSSSGTFSTVSDESGTVTAYGVGRGTVRAVATTAQGTGGTAAAPLVYDDDVVHLTVQLSPAVSAAGTVYQPVPGDTWDNNPASLVPQAGAIVELQVNGTPIRSTTTTADGVFRFDALPLGGYTVAARDPSGLAVAFKPVSLDGPDGRVNDVGGLILDAAPPRIVAAVPTPGMDEVSLSASVEIAFSEPLAAAVTSNLTSFFRLESEHGLVPPGSWVPGLDPSGLPAVRFVQPTDGSLESLTTYTVTVLGGATGVRDLAGRPLTLLPKLGWTFRTSDQAGPRVVATSPDLSGRVDPVAPIRVDFNEAVVANADQLDGAGLLAAARIQWRSDSGWSDTAWPVVLFLTRNDFSLVVDPYDDMDLSEDDGYRRLTVAGLVDDHGNVMPEFVAEYRIFDDTAPLIVDVPFPDGAPTGELSSGSSYRLVPQLAAVDDVTADDPGGDVARVDYFFSAPGEPETSPQPGYSATTHPFELSFVAGTPADGRFDVWVRAVDTSGNWSNTVPVAMTVVANAVPTIASVILAATAPVAGVPYAGSALVATVSGVADADANQLTITARLLADGQVLAVAPSVLVTRPSGGWSALAPPTFGFALPLTVTEGAELVVRTTATDPVGAVGTTDSAPLAVADDATPPTVTSLVAVNLATGAPAAAFFSGDELRFELRARDGETAVNSVELSFEHIFSPLTPTPVAGSPGLYRTGSTTVPSVGFNGETTVAVTATVADRGDNTTVTGLTLTVAPLPDLNAPTVRWLTPWEGAAWPADHGSYDQQGTPLLLRFRAEDTNDGGPGQVSLVEVFLPVDDGAGGLTLATAGTPAQLVEGDESSGVYEVQTRVPKLLPPGTVIPFAAHVVDLGHLEVTSHVRMVAQPARLVVEHGVSAPTFADPLLAATGDPDGAVFLLDGATLSLEPSGDERVRRLPALYLYPGFDSAGPRASVLTAPAVTTYDSLDYYRPLELEVTDTLAVSHGCRVDVAGRGLLGTVVGTDATMTMLLPGMTAPGRWAGGSHGGRGWHGTDGDWNSGALSESPEVYGSLRRPSLPGIGGFLSAEGAGGTGGGVLRLLAAGATVIVEGRITADGEGGNGWSGGGAGGAVDLSAARLIGSGLVSADGGRGARADRSGGGGGGRVALTVGELSSELTVTAAGSGNGGAHLAGAGTVFVAPLDPLTGTAAALGDLVVANPAGLPATVTPLPALGRGTVTAVDVATATLTLSAAAERGDLSGERVVLDDTTGAAIAVLTILGHQADRLEVEATITELELLAQQVAAGGVTYQGRTRLASFTASGSARIVAADQLEVGPAAGPTTLDDRAALNLTGDARILFGGEATTLTVTSDPPVGTDLRVGAHVTLDWSAGDPLGLREAQIWWSFPGGPGLTRFADQPLATSVTGATLPVPTTAPAGPVTMTFRVTTVDGRVVEEQRTWTVLANQAPTATLTLAAGGANPVQAGFATKVQVHAEDLEGLASVTLHADGPAVIPQQVRGLSGTVVNPVFDVQVQPTADGLTDLVLVAVVTDTTGAQTTTGTLVIDVVPDTTEPTVSLSLSPAKPDNVYRPMDSITVTAAAHDDVAVKLLTVSLAGQSSSAATSPLVVSWQLPATPGTYVAEAWAFDPSNNGASATTTISVVSVFDPDAPQVAFVCPRDHDLFATNVAIALDFSLRDATAIPGYRVFVDDAEVAYQPTGTPAVEADGTKRYDCTYTWTPPQGVEAGEELVIRIEATDTDAPTPKTGAASISLRAVGAAYTGSTSIDASDVLGRDLILAGGTYTATEPLALASLTMVKGATLTSPTSQPTVGTDLTVSGQLVVSCGAKIDVSERGYAAGHGYPGEVWPATSGSHLGKGGSYGAPQGSGTTYGSVYRPREAGAGSSAGMYSRAGGGVVRIAAGGAFVEGSILANGGAGGERGGAGGSVLLEVAGELGGTGIIHASGGFGSYSSGGGGAIAVGFHTSSGSVLDHLAAVGGTPYGQNPLKCGGAGTVVTFDAATATYGNLTVDNSGSLTAETVLPALGAGTALSGSGGDLLVTDRETIKSFFVGHWVELTPPGGEPKGVRRIQTIAGGTITFEPDPDGPPVDEWDQWQGVYLFDNLSLSGAARLRSADPLRVTTATLGSAPTYGGLESQLGATATVTVSGKVELLSISAGSLVVTSTGSLASLPAATGSDPATLEIDVDGLLEVAAGGTIDVSNRGYLPPLSYPEETPPTGGGSHLGQGGTASTSTGSTYGSVYRPQEAGSGSGATTYSRSGGGIVHIAAGSAAIHGSILANGGTSGEKNGAGGSIWLEVEGDLGGDGTIQANGGSSGGYPAGGGGAVAVSYRTESGSVTDHLEAGGGWAVGQYTPVRTGGAGTVFVFDALGSTYGRLVIDNAGHGLAQTVLPSLGSGTALEGSGGDVLKTDRPTVQPYFVGHWVELTPLGGEPKGVRRIASIVGGTITFEPDPDGPAVAEQDQWQGVYLFDQLTLTGAARVRSADPLRVTAATLDSTPEFAGFESPISVTGTVTVTGKVEARSITAAALVVGSTGHLASLPVATDGTPTLLVIDVDGLLEVAAGGTIDVSNRGYLPPLSYPEETPPTGGGSHLGQGGTASTSTGSTYGSVYRPQEAGSGSGATTYSRSGGGIVHIAAGSAAIHGSILANGGTSGEKNGAGGSIWLEVEGDLGGDGTIQANGGSSGGYPAGGGGAVAVSYGSSTNGTITAHVQANGGASTSAGAPVRAGGAGTVYFLDRSTTTHGRLLVHNANQANALTVLPSLGMGAAVTGTAGASLMTDRATDIPPYFVGHWVEIRRADGGLKGMWQITAVDGRQATLDLDPEGPVTLAEDDLWRGLYRFDSLEVSGKAKLIFNDLHDIPAEAITVEPGSSVSFVNLFPPTVGQPTLSVGDGQYQIFAAEYTFTDFNGIGTVTVSNPARNRSWTPTVVNGGFAKFALVGAAGDLITVTVRDAHPSPRSTTVAVGTLPANPAAPVIDPERVAIVDDGAQLWVVGQIGAVTDDEFPVSLTLTNQRTNQVVPGGGGDDGDFSVAVAGAGGDLLTLAATDRHPEPLTTSITVGPLPGNEAPAVDPAGVTVIYSSSGVYVVQVAANAVTDDDAPITLVVTEPQGGGPWERSIPSGGATEIWLDDAVGGLGTEITVTATDAHVTDPQSSSVVLTLPADNAGAPEVNDGQISLLAKGLGYQLVGNAQYDTGDGFSGWAEDDDWPLTVTLTNSTTGWQSASVTVTREEPLYFEIVGNQGDLIQLVVRDSHPDLPLATGAVHVGTLPASGLQEWNINDINLYGHTVSRLRGGAIALLDGGHGTAWFDTESMTLVGDGLTAAADLHTVESLGDEITVVDDGDLVSWTSTDDGAGGWLFSRAALTVSQGTLTHLEMLGNDLFTVAEEADGVHLYRVSDLSFVEADAIEPVCGPIQSLLLPDTVGRSALAIAPAAAGTVAVLVDDPLAELRLVDISGDDALELADEIDLLWDFAPTWTEVVGTDVLVGRDDGGVELWRWDESTMAAVAAWTPEAGAATAALRMGDQLWVGRDDGTLEQVSIRTPDSPLLMGTVDLGFPLRSLSSAYGELYVAATTVDNTDGRLVRLTPEGISSDLAAEQLTWGFGERLNGDPTTWVWARPLGWDLDRVKVRWADGSVDSVFWADNGFFAETDGLEPGPPLVWGETSDGVPTPAVVAGQSQLRVLDPPMGAELFQPVRVLPPGRDNCAVVDGAGGAATTADWGWVSWLAFVEAGMTGVTYTWDDGAAAGASVLPTTGQPVAVLNLDADSGGRLAVVAGSLDIWNLDGQNGGDPLNPVLADSVSLFEGHPIVAVARGAGGSSDLLYLAADGPPRLAVVDTSSTPPTVVQNGTGLSEVEGNILGIAVADNGTLTIASDAGNGGQLTSYDRWSGALVEQLDLLGTAPVTRVTAVAAGDPAEPTSLVLVTRGASRIEVYTTALEPLGSVELPGPVSDLRQSSIGAAVTLGNLGVAVVHDLLGVPTVSWVVSNTRPAGEAIRFTDQGDVLTPLGIVWFGLDLSTMKHDGADNQPTATPAAAR